MTTFTIDGLDHVAIRVKNMNTSIKWYEEVLGLKKYQVKEWGPFPIFLLAGNTGVALFPAIPSDQNFNPNSKGVRIDHFAFHLSNENFKKAIKRYEELGIEYMFQDHHYFHSIYTSDPDGHRVELTTLLVDADKFYK